jgi:hypothetical protein
MCRRAHRPLERKRLATAVLIGSAMLFVCGPATPRPRKPQPTQPDRFVIGRRTFFDFGPPFDFYEILSVRPTTGGGTLVERIQVTPAGDVCTQFATVQVQTSLIGESVADLLGRTNPCTIPEKDLSRELKRCGKCLVFSGADIVMQVQCGSQIRRIRMDILDRDMFDSHPVTPEHTSWTMSLLGRLDRTLGSNIMERPAFALPDASPQPPKSESSLLLKDLESGEFDALFPRGSHAPSELFRQARNPPPGPSVELLSSSPFRPTAYALPKYPPIARAAHIDGQVIFTTSVKSDGHASTPSFLSGNPILQRAVAAGASDWTFPPEAAGHDMQVAIEFKMNCPSVQR